MKWPTVEDATRRINVLIGDQAETDMAARDLIVLMRELGRVTAENVDLRKAAEPASEEKRVLVRFDDDGETLHERVLTEAQYKDAIAPPPPPTQGEEENIEKIVARFEVEHAKVGELCSVMPNTHIRALIASWRKRGDENAALRQHADEAARNENIGCAALVERLLQRTYPMDSAYEPIVAAIRARITPKGQL